MYPTASSEYFEFFVAVNGSDLDAPIGGMACRVEKSFPELIEFVQFVRSPEIEGSVSGLFLRRFKNLGAEVHEKSAVKLRDF